METRSQILYIECTIPAGQTITAYRQSRPRKPSVWSRLTAPLRAERLAA